MYSVSRCRWPTRMSVTAWVIGFVGDNRSVSSLEKAIEEEVQCNILFYVSFSTSTLLSRSFPRYRYNTFHYIIFNHVFFALLKRDKYNDHAACAKHSV